MDELQQEQSKHEREITYLCVECERLQGESCSLRHIISQLEERLRNLEDNTRQYNLLFYGVPKKKKETSVDCEQGVMQIINGILGLERAVSVDRAYRADSAVVVRFVSLRDRDLVLSRVKRLRGSGFSIREDVSPTVRQKQKGLLPLYKDLRMAKKRANICHDRLVTNDGVFTYDLQTKSVVRVEECGEDSEVPAEFGSRSLETDSLSLQSISPTGSELNGESNANINHCGSVDGLCCSRKPVFSSNNSIGTFCGTEDMRSVDTDDGWTRETSPLSMTDTAEMLDEVFSDSGISTLTMSTTANSSAWGLAQTMLLPNRRFSLDGDRDVSRLRPTALTSHRKQSTMSDTEFPIGNSLTPMNFRDSEDNNVNLSDIRRDPDDFGRSVKTPVSVPDNTDNVGRGEIGIQNLDENQNEKSSQVDKYKRGVGWFSYLGGNRGRSVSADNLLALPLNTVRSEDHGQRTEGDGRAEIQRGTRSFSGSTGSSASSEQKQADRRQVAVEQAECHVCRVNRDRTKDDRQNKNHKFRETAEDGPGTKTIQASSNGYTGRNNVACVGTHGSVAHRRKSDSSLYETAPCEAKENSSGRFPVIRNHGDSLRVSSVDTRLRVIASPFENNANTVNKIQKQSTRTSSKGK